MEKIVQQALALMLLRDDMVIGWRLDIVAVIWCLRLSLEGVLMVARRMFHAFDIMRLSCSSYLMKCLMKKDGFYISQK